MFTDNSRYLNLQTYLIKDRRGRTVNVVQVPAAPAPSFLGYHMLMQGQRIDHLASKYLMDDTGFWRIAEANDAMLADALTEKPQITIPEK